jgi:hypothetical protein
MNTRNIQNTLIIFLMFMYVHAGYAADSMSHKNPQFVLVQVSSEHNRVAAMTKDRKYKELAEVQKDAAAVAETMKLDFKDHFTYCPVWYFIDTNIDRIKNMQFDGVLFNADGAPVKNPAVSAKGKNYLIAYYGYPVADAGAGKPVTDSVQYHYNSGEPMGKGLVINNYKFQQVGYFYKFGYQEALFTKKASKRYVYHSKHFDIDYFPQAEKFNKKLKDRR